MSAPVVSRKVPNWRKLKDPLLERVVLNTRFLYLTEFVGEGILTYSDRDIAAWWNHLNEALENGRLFLTKAYRKHIIDHFDLLLELKVNDYKPLLLLIKNTSFEFVLAMFILEQVALGHREAAVRAYEYLRGLQDRQDAVQWRNIKDNTTEAGKKSADARTLKTQETNRKVVAEAIELLNLKKIQKREIIGILANKAEMPSAKHIRRILQKAGIFTKKR